MRFIAVGSGARHERVACQGWTPNYPAKSSWRAAAESMAMSVGCRRGSLSSQKELISYRWERRARDETTAEICLAVADAWQGKGIRMLMLERLALIAASNGIRHFWAMTMFENNSMLDGFRTQVLTAGANPNRVLSKSISR